MQTNQQPFSINTGDYNTVFGKKIIPTDRPGHNYYNANNINFVQNLENIETSLIVIDSASRQWDKESSNNYIVNLGDTFQYVHSMELIDGYVPASGYLINETNNRLHFQEDDNNTIEVAIEPGNYNITQLLKCLSKKMMAASTDERKYKCVIDSITNKVTIDSNQPFNLIFTSGNEIIGDRGLIETMTINPLTHKKEFHTVETSDSRSRYNDASIGKILGFKAIDLYNLNSYTGQMIYELHSYKYLGIFVNTENDADFKKISAPCPNNGTNGAFAVVALTNNEQKYDLIRYNQIVDNGRFIKTFNPPIHFNKLKIQFRTPDGHLYDFNGLDNYLVFEIKKIFGRETIKTLNNLT